MLGYKTKIMRKDVHGPIPNKEFECMQCGSIAFPPVANPVCGTLLCETCSPNMVESDEQLMCSHCDKSFPLNSVLRWDCFPVWMKEQFTRLEIDCPLLCGEVELLYDIDYHLKYKCPNRIVKCPNLGCYKESYAHQLENRHYQKCSKYEEPIPKDDGRPKRYTMKQAHWESLKEFGKRDRLQAWLQNQNARVFGNELTDNAISDNDLSQ